MAQHDSLGGTFHFPGTGLVVHRMGYGAMQLAGSHVFGPPRDRPAALAVLRAAIAAGVNHIDTSDYYGPHVTNQVIREALHPYPPGLVIVTKFGARRDDKGGWIKDLSQANFARSIEDNLANLGLDAMDVVNLRLFSGEDDVGAPLKILMLLREQGLIRHIGVSNVTPEQVQRARDLAPIVCVQNEYNLANRSDDDLIDELNAAGIAYTPFFPLGGFSPLQSSTLDEVAKDVGEPAMKIALAWLLQRSPNILLIPGTSSLAHLHDNLAAASLHLPREIVARLDTVALSI